ETWKRQRTVGQLDRALMPAGPPASLQSQLRKRHGNRERLGTAEEERNIRFDGAEAHIVVGTAIRIDRDQRRLLFQGRDGAFLYLAGEGRSRNAPGGRGAVVDETNRNAVAGAGDRCVEIDGEIRNAQSGRGEVGESSAGVRVAFELGGLAFDRAADLQASQAG